MRSIKGVLVALVAVLAFGVVAASGASAHEYFIEGKSMKSLGLKEEAVSSETSSVTVSSPYFEVVCEAGSGSGTIREGGGGVSTLNLSGCRVEAPNNCGVKPIVLQNTSDNLVEVGGQLASEFAPEAGRHLLFSLEFANQGGSCFVAGVWEAEGQATGKVVSEAEKEVSELSFTATSGSHIVGAGTGFTLKMKDKIKLSGADKGKKWAAKK